MIPETIAFKLAVNWLEKLSKTYISRGIERNSEIDAMTDELLVVPQDLAPVFIEPYLQVSNPADQVRYIDEHKRDKTIQITPVFNYLEEFIKATKVQPDGRRQLFILADAGMGKTSVLAMFKLAHINSLWPKGFHCLPLKLGPDTLNKLRDHKNYGRTVLLLDALDEDQLAFGRVEDRIAEILKATMHYFRVVITCRNQFLPLGNSCIFPRPDRIRIGGFTCPVNYVSPFDIKQVRLYLDKHIALSFSGLSRLEVDKKISDAEKLILETEDVFLRPMLLAYINDLIGEDLKGNQYYIYKHIVHKWLDREERNQGISSHGLLRACFIVARYINGTGSREIKDSEIQELTKENPVLNELKYIDIGGRSLLNRKSDGSFVFAHQSFQEFLLLYSLEYDFPRDWSLDKQMLKKFLSHSLKENKGKSIKIYSNIRFQGLSGEDLPSIDLENINLKEVDLSSADLANGKLKGTNLSKANLTNVNLKNANLVNSNLYCTDLSNACLDKTKIKGANLSGANLSNASLLGVDLSDTNLDCVILHNTKIDNLTVLPKKQRIVHSVVNKITFFFPLSRSDLSKTFLEGADFEEEDMEKINLKQSWLVGAKFRGSNLKFANLSLANLEHVSFTSTCLHGANFEDAVNWDKIFNIENADITGVINPPPGFRTWALENGAFDKKLSNRETTKPLKTWDNANRYHHHCP